jgi:hypothetical protein
VTRVGVVRGLAVAMAMAAGLWAGPCFAALMLLTVDGTASPTGSYAPFAASFPQFGAGQQPAPYTLLYTYDTGNGAAPISQASLSILDGTYLLDGFTVNTVGPAGGGIQFFGAVPTGGSYIQTNIVGGFPGGLASPFSVACPQGCGSGIFQLPFGSGALNLTVTGASTRILPPPVPEPATWAMLIGGFFAIGTMLRRRRSVLLVSA